VVIFGLGMRYYLRVRAGLGFGLINLVILHSENRAVYSLELILDPLSIISHREHAIGGGGGLTQYDINGSRESGQR